MVSEYHRTVEKGIMLLGKCSKNAGKVRKLLKGNENPLSLVDPKNKLVLNYKPDVYFILRNNKKLIFEILDSEEKKQDKIIADIIRSFLIENVEALIFIYPGSENDENTILEALKTIYKSLVDKGIQPKELPNPRKTGPYSIKRTEAPTPEAVKSKLERYSIC